MSRTGDYIPAKVRRQVAMRANFMCEYCLMPDDPSSGYYKHQIDHIISLKHRGTNGTGNLAYCCFHCNSCKGPDVGSIYDKTGLFVGFFNPRTQNWSDHFDLLNFVIEPITATGWVTAMMLQFNTPMRIELRRLL